MAVTQLTWRRGEIKAELARDAMGQGSPVSDPILANDTIYPIGSSYLNLTSGAIWYKTSAGINPTTGAIQAGAWVNSSTVATA